LQTTDNSIIVHTGPRHPTSSLNCERCALDADIMGEAGISDNDRHERHPQHNVLIASIATVWRHVSFGGLHEWLVALPFLITGSGTESTDPGDVKLDSVRSVFSWTVRTLHVRYSGIPCKQFSKCLLGILYGMRSLFTHVHYTSVRFMSCFGMMHQK